MKTHQEIHDAIKAFEAAVYSTEATPIVLNILHALNDRIEALDALCFARNGELRIITANIGSDLARVEKRLEEIHPTIT